MTILDPEHTFSSLSDSVGLDVRLRKAIARLGYSRPTLVQSKCLPLAISSGRDLCVRAQTGSGKTLAFLLPLLQSILSKPDESVGVRGIILVPTRELCAQVQHTVQQLTYYCDNMVRSAVLSTGRARGEKGRREMERQEAVLRDHPNVLVATPNGLLAHIQAFPSLKTTVETVVVDEADLFLSFGYSKDITEIGKALPRVFQGFIMSATLSPELDALKSVVLHSPVILKLEKEHHDNSEKAGKLKQFYLKLPREDKNLVIYVFLRLGLLKGKGLFFVNSVDGGYRLKLFLEQFHIRSAVLNAELPLKSRLNIIEQFNIGSFDYLIATDDSADAAMPRAIDQEDEGPVDARQKRRQKDTEYGVSRGLDFRDASFVVNVDFPPNAKSYAHRVGRTARGGADGVALSLVDGKSQDEHQTLWQIQDEQPKLPMGRASSDNLQASMEITIEHSKEMKSPDQPQPVLLDFDLHETEGFRYRVEDVQRAVTRAAVREARAAELKAEALNSDRLQSHFEDNPADLQILRHDRLSTDTTRVQEHLKHVPKYLLPRGMQVADLNRKRKKRKRKGHRTAKGNEKDPLRSFEGDVTFDGINGEVDDPLNEEFVEDSIKDAPTNKNQKSGSDYHHQVFVSTKDGTGRSTAGRNSWKEKHRKGAFSGKMRKSERKKKEPLGI